MCQRSDLVAWCVDLKQRKQYIAAAQWSGELVPFVIFQNSKHSDKHKVDTPPYREKEETSQAREGVRVRTS